MTTKTRFLTGSLATLAVASAVTLAAPSAGAASLPDVPCGQAATPAVYQTVKHEPVVREVPAVTHPAWLWQRDVTTTSYEFSRVVRAAYTEYLWAHRVITQPAVAAVPAIPEKGHFETVEVTPAVTVTLFQYEQQTTHNLSWHEDGWNGEKDDVDHGRGWARTGVTETEIVTPAVTTDEWVVDQAAVPGIPAVEEVSHVEQTWATEPGGDDSTKVDERMVPAVLDTVWADAAPDGFLPTGASRSTTTTVETDEASATAPDGDGWTHVPGSVVQVVDQPATTELVGGSTEVVLISPAKPAGEPCLASAPAPASTSAMSPASAPAVTHVGVKQAVDAVSDAASQSTNDAVLPETGNPVSALLLVTGLGAVVAGGVLVGGARRRPTV